MDDSTTQQGGFSTSSPFGSQSGVRAGYCQECGQELTFEGLHRVGNGVYCATCANLQQAGTGWQQVSSGAYRTGGPGAPYPPTSSSAPNPVLAGLLGFIPGVGAMYNAQFAKGAMHLIVFVILVALADNLNWVFWWLVWGWIFYQAFEAYHTARARRDYMPLPNPFGWNDLGERMGFGRTSPPPPPARPGPEAVRAGVPRDRDPFPNWAGYVPPQPSNSAPYSPFAEHTSANPYAAPFTAPETSGTGPAPSPISTVPYAPTYTGVSIPGQTPGVPTLTGTNRRFPVGAVWLIGLGLLFLSGNLLPGLRLTGQWFVPLLLAGLALWTGFRRWETLQRGQGLGRACSTLPGALTGPAILLAISMLFALQAAHLVSIHRSWPILLVVWGGMQLLQRGARAVAGPLQQSVPEPVAAPVRSTSGTGTYGL